MIETKPLENDNLSVNPRLEAIAIPEAPPKFGGNDKRAKILALIVTAQVGALFAFGVPYAQTLAHGKNVTLQCHQYDPRDMLKGDYVAINYDLGEKYSLKDFKVGDRAYLTLKKHSPWWEAVTATKTVPKNLKTDEAVMQVVVNCKSPPSVSAAIERYYVQEGTARNVNSQGLTAEVALSDDGLPVIKLLLSDGHIVGEPIK